MKDYLWLFLLGGIALVALLFFLITFSRDVFLFKRLRYKRRHFALNFSFMGITLFSLGLIVYLFTLLKEQIELLY